MKRAIVIGATSGIGKELAMCLAAEGWRVGIMGRRMVLLDELAISAPISFVPMQVDVAKVDEAVSAWQRLVKQLGGVDLCILSAGIGELNPSLDFCVERDTLQINVMGWTAMVDAVFRHFEQQGYGHLVVLSSVGGLRGSGDAPAYNASKAYQMNYAEGLRLRATRQKFPIVVTDIRPGLVDTAMAKGEGLFWVMPVERVAEQIMQAIRQRKRVAVVTRRWRLVAWLLRHLPNSLYERVGG